MRKIATALALAAVISLTAAAIATPALADVDFRFGINLGPPAYYGPYYGYRPYYYDPYYNPYYGPHYYRYYR